VVKTLRGEVICNAENLTYRSVYINGDALAKPADTGVIQLHSD
jgi:hypothetical protein